jgi:hypothetical protein
MEGPTMPKSVEIENIEELRRREGIVDVELREEICGLQIGDFVKVTLLTGARSCGETVSVRITGIRGNAFRGKTGVCRLIETPDRIIYRVYQGAHSLHTERRADSLAQKFSLLISGTFAERIAIRCYASMTWPTKSSMNLPCSGKGQWPIRRWAVLPKSYRKGMFRCDRLNNDVLPKRPFQDRSQTGK